MPLPVLKQLRQATDAAHQALHQHPLLSPLTSGDITQARYTQILQAFYGFYLPLEQRIAGTDLAGTYELYASPMLTWLRQDLRFYAVDLHDIPLCEDSPIPARVDELLGVLYVREGSLLGGQVICRLLNQRLAASTHSFRFFHGWGDATAARWRTLLTVLDSCAQEAGSEPMCRSAAKTFECLQNWLDGRARC